VVEGTHADLQERGGTKTADREKEGTVPEKQVEKERERKKTRVDEKMDEKLNARAHACA